MKKHRHLLALILFCISQAELNAQVDIQQWHLVPRQGDVIRKHILDSPLEKETGKNAIWDFSHIKPTCKYHVVKYSQLKNNDSIIVATENDTRSYYRQKDDFLYLDGYENNLTHACYTAPLLFLHTPLTYGDVQEQLFQGSIAYCEKMYMRAFGSSCANVDGKGMMIVPSGDTLSCVNRVHIKQVTGIVHCPNLRSKEELRKLADSSPFSADSIVFHLQSDSLLNETNIYRWYALGYRYPIMETIETGLKGEKPSECVTYYCDPEELSLLTDGENEELRSWIEANNICYYDITSEEGNSLDNHRIAITDLCVSSNGSTVHITFNLTDDASIIALISDVKGIIYRQASRNGLEGETCGIDIDCSGLRKGEYVVYLNVNGLVTSTTVNIE